ncbi:MAG: chemotaxis protein CheA [Firmicutes bacterium HGW-Firmicutes-14]|nr:MAG: chemotaxis protein CheA [Firmicutes bacterium HGW-Firmicutes-14]
MDMSQYRGMFLEEAREHLQKLNEALLELEDSHGGRTTLDEIFRSAHTLKGMSATMGYNQIAELTHGMEDVLQKLRSGDIEVSTDIVDLLFKCVDSLDSMVNDITEGGSGSKPVGDLLQRLKSGPAPDTVPLPAGTAGAGDGVPGPEANESRKDHLSEGLEQNQIISVEFNEYEKNLIKQAIDQGFQCYHLVVNIDKRCVMKSARAFMVFKKLEEIGEIIKTIPSVQDIEEEKFETSFELIIISVESAEVIRNSLISITELLEPHIKSITGVFTNHAKRDSQEDEGTKPPVQPKTPENDDKTGNGKREEPAACPVQSRPKASQTVRVDTARLDNLMNLVGELVINKGRLEQIGRASELPDLPETLEQMDRVTSELQNVVMKVRMVPIDSVFCRFPRMVRDLARDLGKEIELVIEGKETELDRTVIDEIGDPLVHLLRNSIDHGIEEPAARVAAGKSEQGRLTLSARHEGNNVVIEVADDGKGLNPEEIKNKALEKGLLLPDEAEELDHDSIIRLIMQPGLSTAEKVTDISGRGVGLDAVKNKIETLSGSISINSTPGEGTKFKIQLPLTLAIIQALLVKLEAETYAIPLSFIAETTSLMPEQVNKIQDQEVILLRGDVLPLVRLHEILQVPPADVHREEEINVVVVKKGEKRVGLIVDILIGQQEIVIKPLGKLLGNIPVIAGGTILGNGQVSLIIDVAGLL